MAKVESKFLCDLSKPVQAQVLKGNVFSLDNLGSRISVLVYDNGSPATITGSVTANCILPDGSTVNVNGSLTTENGGSKAYVDIPQSCLLIPGILKIAIKVTASSVITTLAAIVANVYMTKTDNVITPSQQVITDWNAEISAAIADQDAAISAQDDKIDDLKSALSIVEGASVVPYKTFSVTNNYYTGSSNYKFSTSKKYRITVTVGTSGTYTIQIGNNYSAGSMVDTLTSNQAFTANTPISFFGYTPSTSGLYVIRINSNSIAWDVNIEEVENISDVIERTSKNENDISELELYKGNTNKVIADIFTIGAELTKASTVANYVCDSDGTLVSNTNYKTYKYLVTAGNTIYVKADKITRCCSVSFRSSDSGASDNVVLLMPNGVDAVLVAPTGATHLFVSCGNSDTTAVAKVATFTGSSAIPDGAVGYTKLNDYLQGKIDEIGAITTETGVGVFHAEDDDPDYGNELLDGTGWSGTGWTGDFANGFTHESGTDPLERTIESLEANALYKFTITTSDAKTNGYSDFYVSLGGSQTFETYKGGGSSVSYVFGLIASSQDSKLKITPSSYTGTITGLSLKKVTNASQLPAVVISDTDENPTAKIITGKSQNTSIFIGLRSGEQSIFGESNTVLGVNSMKTNTDGFWNTAVGMNALADNIHGTRNVAVGYIALQHCVTGDRNIAIGSFALNSLTSGRGNIAIGADAMQTVNANFGIGIGVGSNCGGDENIGIGHRAGNTSGQKNTIVGGYAMESASNAGFSVAVGYQAGQKSTGSYNVEIGAMAGKNSASGDNNIIIGYNAQKQSVTDSNSIVIGTANHDKVIIAGKIITFNQDGTVTWGALS